MKVLVCGGRDFNDKKLVYNTLDQLCVDHDLRSEPDEYGNWMPRDIVIIHGTARGADSLADDWAVVNWVPTEEFKPDWNTHGKAAGILRNIDMLKEGKPDLVVAFPGGRGTAHMVKIAKEAGVEVFEVRN